MGLKLLWNATVALSAVTLVCACTKHRQATSNTTGATDTTSSTTAPASPAPVAVNCNQTKPQTAPANSPTDDILGVRPGLLPKQAQDILICENPRYSIDGQDDKGGNFGIPPYPDGTMALNGFNASEEESPSTPGDKIIVNYVGLPGEERVAGIGRTMTFPAGHEPTIGSIRDQLIKKYGAPNGTLSGGATILRWIHSPDGSLVSEHSDRMMQCTQNSGAGSSVNSDCGLTITATIYTSNDNPAAAASFNVAIIDQATTYAVSEAAKNAVNAKRGTGGVAPKM